MQRDARGYWEHSSLVMQGDVLMQGTAIAYRTPAYPWFLALARLISGSSLLFIAIFQGAFYLASVWMAAVLASRISRHSSAKVFTLLVMLPAVSALTYVSATLTETYFVFLLMLNLITVSDYTKYETKTRAVLVGFTFGLTLLTRPVVLLIWVAHIVFALLIHMRRKLRHGNHVQVPLSQHIKNMLLAGIVVVVMVAPWVGRNYAMFGKPFLTEFLGRNLWIVAFQGGSGAGLKMPNTVDAKELKERLTSATDGSWQSTKWRRTWTVSDLLTKSGLDDAETDRLMKQVAFDAMEQDPPTVRYKSVRRIVNFWRCPATNLPSPSAETENAATPQTWTIGQRGIRYVNKWKSLRISQSVWLNTVLMATIFAAVFFLLWYWPTRPFGIWILLMLAYFCVLTGLVEIPDYRYRLVVEPIAGMAIGAVLAIAWSKYCDVEPELELEIDS